MGLLQDKVCLITGGAGSIGLCVHFRDIFYGFLTVFVIDHIFKRLLVIPV